MANESTSSTLSELYTEIVAEAQFVASEKSIMRNLVKNYAISGGGKAVEVPVYAQVSAAEFLKQLTYLIQRLTQHL